MEKRCDIEDAQILAFEWDNKWLKGEEYAHMLHNIDRYCKAFNLLKVSSRCHPDDIYQKPRNGFIYFMEGSSIGSEFGFPRVEQKKLFKWKKMNFTTELPKRNPIVSYIVASAVKCERFFPNTAAEGPAYRMHAVVLSEPKANSYILCHIRKLANYEESSPKLREVSPAPVKKIKREPLTPMKVRVQALLDAANELVSPIKSTSMKDIKIKCKSINKENENDYVSLFRCSSLSKFPLFTFRSKPLFQVVHPK